MRKTLLIFLPIFFAAFSLKAQEIVGSNDTTICHGSPAELHASLINGSYGTSSYSFETYAYTPEAFTGGTHVAFIGDHDDKVSGPFNIGFNFCFFNQTYTQFCVGSNGWVGFTYNTNWTAYNAELLPNAVGGTPQNCIFAPWLDWWPDNPTNPTSGEQNVFYYTTGTAPNRKLVVYWKNCSMFNNSCQNDPEKYGTFQIVLNEQSSVIDNHIQYKPICQNEVATQGVQNLGGTQAFIATGRNQTVWSAQNESTRFVPSGIKWYTGGYPGGTVVGYGAVLNVSPSVTTTYTVVVETCAGGGAITKNITVTVIPLPTADAGPNIVTCMPGTGAAITSTATNYSTVAWSTSSTTGGYFNNPNTLNTIYYPSLPDIVAGSVTLTLTATGAPGCNAFATSSMTLSAAPYPIALAGIDGSVCSNSSYSLNGSASGSGLTVWTKSGDGGFLNPNSPITLYTPGPNDILNGEVDLYITSNGSGPCTGFSDADTIHLTVIHTPSVFAGDDFQHCVGTDVTLSGATADYYQSVHWSTSGTGTFVDSTLVHAVYRPSAADILGKTVDLTLHIVPTSPCVAISDHVQVTLVRPPTANAGPSSDAICASGFYTLSASDTTQSPGIVWTSSGTGTFSDGLALHPVYTPSTDDTLAGTVTLTLTASSNAPCSVAVDDLVLSINPLPVPTAFGPPSVCLNSTGKVYLSQSGMNGYSWETSSGGIITAGGTPTADTAMVTWNTVGPQFVKINYSNAYGCSAVAATQFPVMVNPLPNPNVYGNKSVCLNTSHIYFTEEGMTDYEWNLSPGGTITAGVGNDTITVLWSGDGIQMVNVNYADANGCRAENPTYSDITVQALPEPILGGPSPVCFNSIDNEYSTDGAMTDYIWNVTGGTITSGGIGTSNKATVHWDGVGPYSVSVNYTNSDGCTAALPTVYNVTVNTLPIPDLSGPNPVCFNSEGNVYTTNSAMTGYIWNISGGTISEGGTSTSNTATVKWDGTGPHSINVNYTDNNGCKAAVASTYNVTVNSLPIPALGGINPVCFNSSGNIYTTDATMTNYLWSVNGGTITDGGNTSSNTATVKWDGSGPHSIQVNYTNSDGCTAPLPSIYNVTVNPLPVPALSGNSPVCFNSSGNVYSTDVNMSNYLWSISGGTITSDGTLTSNTATVTWDGTGPYSIHVNYTNGDGCTAALPSTFPVTVNPLPIPALGGTTPACFNSTNNVYTTNASMTNYIWGITGGTITDGGTSTSNTATVKWDGTAPHAITVNYTNENGCVAAQPSNFNVTVNPLPIPALSGPTPACFNSSGNIYTTDASKTNYIWNISGGTITGGGTSTSNTATVKWDGTGPHSINVNYTDANQCVAAAPSSFNVTVNPLPIPALSGTTPACFNSSGNVYTTDELMSNYVWGISGGTIIAGGTLTSNTTTVKWDGSGVHSINVKYTDGNGCTAASASVFNVTVNPLPIPALGGPSPVCFNSDGNIYTTDAGMTNYIWSISGGTITTGGTATSNTATVKWDGVSAHSISVVYTDANGCVAANPSVFNVVINPLPVPTVSGPAVVCATSPGNIYSTQTNKTDYNWIVTPGGVITSGINSASATVTWNTPGTHTIVAVYKDANGCQGISAAYTVTVNPLPQPVISGLTTPCESVVGNIYTTAANMSGYNWVISSGGTISSGQGSNTISVKWSTPGPKTLSVTYTDLNSCGTQTPGNLNIDVHPYPISNAGENGYICSDQPTYQLNGSGFYFNSSKVDWDFYGLGYHSDGNLNDSTVLNPIFTPSGSDLTEVNRVVAFVLTLEGTGSCAGLTKKDTMLLRIDPTPVANAGPDGEICGQRNYQLTASALFENDIIWKTNGDGTFNDTSVLSPIYKPGPADVGKNIQLSMNLAGCKGLVNASSMLLTVHPDPSATMSGVSAICEGESTTISIAFTGTAPWDVTYTDGSNPVTVNGIMVSPFQFDVTPTLASSWWLTAANDNFCDSPVDSLHGSATISVNPLPRVFNVTGSNGGFYCAGDTGVLIGIDNSEIGMTYELLRNNLPFGKILSGNGGSQDFGYFSTPGQYSVLANNPIANCLIMMNDTITVIMNPIPVTDFSTNLPCTSDTTYFTLSGDYLPRTSTWFWDFGDGTYATYSAPYSPIHVYPTYSTYTVTLSVVDTNGCHYTVTHPVEVLPHPNAFFSTNTPNCLDGTTHFTDLSGNPPGQGYLEQWIWTFGDGTPNDTTNFPNTPNINHTYTSSGTYPVTLTVRNNRWCSSFYQSTVTVTNRPIAGFDYFSNCEDQNALFTDNSNENLGGQITAWAWDFGDPTTGALNTSTEQDPSHLYTATGDFIVKLIVHNLNGCRDSIQDTVHVKAAPLANFFSSAGCQNSPTQFLSDSTLMNMGATATYAWDFGDGGTAYSRNSYHTYLAPGTYSVKLTITDTAGCEGFKILLLTVTPPPTAHFTATTDNCQGQSVPFTDLSQANSGFLTTWHWDFGDGNNQTIPFPQPPNTSHTYSGTGIFNVTLTVTNSEGCTRSESNLVNVLEAPAAAFQNSGHCKGTPVSFTDQSTVSGTQNISGWKWDFGDPTSGVQNTSTSQNPTHTFATAATYTVKLITFTGNDCSDTTSKSITIKPNPVADFNTQSACANNLASFAPAGIATGSIATWYWTFGDGGYSTEQAPTHIYTSPGTYSVSLSLTDTAGCADTRTKPIVIAPLPDANFGYTTPTCKTDAVSFTDLSGTASGYVAKWIWDFGDGNFQTVTFPTPPNVTHAYSNAGTFNVSLTVKTNDSCTNQIVRVLTILPKPTAGFLHGASCVGNLVPFTDQSSSNTTGTIGTWSWDFGDPSTGTANNSAAQNPTHTYTLAGTYTAKLVVTIPGGCSDTATQQIVVSAPPTVDFTPTPGCNGDTTQFVSSTLVNLAATQSWYWQFGDGTTSILADPVHIYSTSGLYTVTLVLTDTAGCTNTMTKAVTVIPAPLAAFSSSTPGCSGQAISFTDLSTANGGTLTTWLWTFGDGTDTTFTSAIPTFTHTYAQPGTFAATLQVLSAEGCQNQAQHTIVISPPPIAAFGYANTCEGQTAEFTDETNLNGGTSLTQHAWDFGDPNSGVQNTSTQTNPTHNFTEAGQYVVKLVALNASGCVDTLSKVISITPKPGLGFYSDSLTCLGNTTTLFTDTLLTQIGGIAYFEWDFGDGSPHAFTQNASHHYAIPGTFSVTLLVQDTAGCENALTKPLTIHTAPIPAFSFSGICQNSPTQFTDLSQAPTGDTITSWYWDFGLAGTTDTSTLKNPDFTYTAPGTYTVKLITATENGCSNEKSLPLQVWNTPKAVFNYSASPCANGLVQFQDSSWSYQGTVTSWQWVFEPYQFGTGTNPSHLYYAVDSCYEVKLAIQDLRGCVDTTLKTVCVPAPLTVSFVPTPNCFGQPAAFVPQMLTPEPQADSLITFNWNFGDPASGATNTSSQKLPTHTFSNIGFYTVNFTAVDKFGCNASAYKTIEVKALPMANFTYTPGTCDSTVSFLSTSTDTSSAINTYIWQYGDGNSDTLTTAQSTHKYTSSGSYVATLTVINQNGCTSSISDTVTRSACIVAAYLNPASLLCQDYDLRFADISTCDGTITQWEWDFGDGSAPTQYNTYQPSTNHTFTDPGTYTIKLKVSTQVGSSTVSDSTEVDILVRPTPLAGFTANPVCLGEKTVFSDTTLANGATAMYYLWEFGDAGNQDTSNLKNPNYLYSSPGGYTTELVATNQFGCADTATKIALVNGLPGANYSNSLACTGQQTYFFDASQNYMAPVSAWVWRVRDTLGYLGNMQGSTPTFVFDSTGNYTVMLAVADTNGCADTLTQQVKVDPSPSSAFDFTDNVDEIQGQLQFTNGSTGGTEYYWDFGNGETSYRESPLITYQEDGTYQIMLVTVSGKGCQDTAFSTYEMIFKGLYVPNAFAPGGSVQSTRLWKPVGVNLAQYLAEVYDSHGAKLWSSSLLDNKGTPVEGWDGSFNEKPCQQDVYVWKISAVFRDGSVWYNKDVGEHKGLTEPVWGTITLIK